MKKAILTYLRDVIKTWWFGIGVVWGISTRLLGVFIPVDIPPRLWLSVLVVLLFVAQFSAWRKQWKDRDLEATLKKLSLHREKIDELHDKSTRASTQEAFEGVVNQYRQVRKEVCEDIRTGINEARANTFRTIGEPELLKYHPRQKGQFPPPTYWKRMMRRDFKHLEQLINEYSLQIQKK